METLRGPGCSEIVFVWGDDSFFLQGGSDPNVGSWPTSVFEDGWGARGGSNHLRIWASPRERLTFRRCSWFHPAEAEGDVCPDVWGFRMGGPPDLGSTGCARVPREVDRDLN